MLSLGVVALTVLFACARDREARTATTTGVEIPQPAATGTASRTLYSTGWVDNAGRTSDERARTEASGMRASEVGSERPTGTPGSGFRAPILEPFSRPPPHVGEGADVDGEVEATSGVPVEVNIGRITRARCDHEIHCGRVGQSGAFKSDASCMASLRDRTREDVNRMACPNGFNAAQVALCLTAIRQAQCATSGDVLDLLPACQRSALCAAE